MKSVESTAYVGYVVLAVCVRGRSLDSVHITHLCSFVATQFAVTATAHSALGRNGLRGDRDD